MSFLRQRRAWLIPAVLLVILLAIISYSLRPEAVVNRAMRRLSLLTTAEIIITLELTNVETTQQLLGEQGVIRLTYEGDLARQDEGADNAAGKLNIAITTDSLQVQASGQVRLIDDAFYLRIEKAPKVFPVLVQLKDRWVKIPRAKATVSGGPTRAAESAFRSYQRIGSEEIAGRSATHYEVAATGEAVVGLMERVADILGTDLSGDQIAELTTGIDTTESILVDIWILPYSQRVVKLQSTFSATSGNEVTFRLEIRDHNKVVELTVPSEAKTIEQIVAEQ